MAESKVYEYEVPEGFPAMSRPTEPSTRLAREKIKIVYCEESDLQEFPDLFWDWIENKDDRPPLSQRIKLLAKHFKPWLSQQGYHAIKAVHVDTGEMMGIAGWHEVGVYPIFPTQYKHLPGLTFPNTFVPCCWRDDNLEELGFAKREGWSENDVEGMTYYHTKPYKDNFMGYDKGRLAELKDQPHWYLAPFCVWGKWEGRGVGRELMRWGLDRADEKGWPAVLEALPNARPVYYHLGFEPTDTHGPDRETQLVRPARQK